MRDRFTPAERINKAVALLSIASLAKEPSVRLSILPMAQAQITIAMAQGGDNARS
ncbi:hypothetical protein GCM10011273_03300 [Asticcacaulis endophyticus]|uniref:Uncharacterized protein n=1 Tax=Asticcacaulis endophyticus TaxID=1395890 RepID=A0A918UN31_9CAUL|nr:hypothetical protein GCM10011273_03300 [Asticcacaulis endophyticus]